MGKKSRPQKVFVGLIGGTVRPQDINTPQALIDAIVKVWPEGIELDPCSNEQAIPFAKQRMFKPIRKNGKSGLRVPWPDFTYVNPPYNNLKEWIPKLEPGHEHMMLCPVRTNRSWFCKTASQATLCCFLKPFAFVGHTQHYPVSVVMLYMGNRREEFRTAFQKLGFVGQINAF